jgi:transporter family-2 protein
MKFWYGVAAMGAGALLTVQAGVNATLGNRLGNLLQSAVVSLCVSAAAIVVCALAVRVPLPDRQALASAPWWAWTGGLVGAVFVPAGILLAPKLGSAAFMGLIIAGQLLCALLVDHCALIGFAEHPLNAGRLLGAALLAAGVSLILLN